MIRKNKGIYWGIILILIAVATLGIAFDLITGNVTKLIWSFLLGGVVLINLVELSWGGVFFPLAIIAHIYRPELSIPRGSMWAVYTAALLLTIGFQMISRNFRSKKRKRGFKVNVDGEDIYVSGKHVKDKVKESVGGFGSSYYEENEGEIVYVENNFGDASRYVNSINLKRAEVENNFGNLRVYFDNAVFSPSGATIKVDCNFGKTTLYLPRDVNIINNVTASLGAVTGSGNRASVEGAPTVVVDGDAAFGNIDIVII